MKGRDRISDQKYSKNFVNIDTLDLLIHKLSSICKRLAI